MENWNWNADWWFLCLSVFSCESTSLCMCHHTSFCRSVFAQVGQVPKDVPIILSTLLSRWHQMVVTKENLVHPHPLLSFWDTHTYAHTSRRTKSMALPWTGLFVHLPVCHFWRMYLYFFHIRERTIDYISGLAVAQVPHLHDDRQLNENQCILSNKLTDNLQWKGALEHFGLQSRWGFSSGPIDRFQEFTKARHVRERDLFISRSIVLDVL